MYKPKNDFLDPQKPCAVCGGQEFEWGRLAGQVFYIPGVNLWRRKGRQVIKIRRCVQCNNLLQFSDAELTRQQDRAVLIVLILVFAVMSVVLYLALLPALLLTTH